MEHSFMPPTITVLAGVNGAGKSSVAGAMAKEAHETHFDPDEAARTILSIHRMIRPMDANAQAWMLGKSLLERAIKERLTYSFETTLGGNTIPRLLEEAAQSGCELNIWFVGLDSADRHIHRVAARVTKGGHAIPEKKIRERWTSSRENLIRLMPAIHHLLVFDNSAEADPAKGQPPRPVLLLEMKRRKITAPSDLSQAPDWAKPILAAAIKLHQTI